MASVLGVVMLAIAVSGGFTATVAHADDGFVTDYDTDGNGVISRDEAIAAVADYFAGELTRDQVLTVIQYYFSGASVPPPVEEPVHDPPVEGETLAQMIERVRPAVVFVRKLGVGSGSGVIFDTEGKTGYVMTAAHVVDDVTEGVWVRTDDGEWYEATLLRADPIRDLAVLTICCDDFIAVDFADPDDVAVGDDVVVMGYPTLLGVQTAHVSKGIVSAYRYNWLRDMIQVQTDADSNPGNSGSPLLTADGLIAGIMQSGRDFSISGRPLEGYEFGAAVSSIQTHMEFLLTPGGEFIFEDVSGSIQHDPDRSTIKERVFEVNYSDGRSDLEFETTFTNPYSADTQLWSYGLSTRIDPAPRDDEDLPELKFVIDSMQRWLVVKVAPSDPRYTYLIRGTSAMIRTGEGETNHLKVRTVGAVAKLYINGQQVGGSIDISSVPHPGDIGVFTGYWSGSERAGAVTEFENLRGKLLDQ